MKPYYSFNMEGDLRPAGAAKAREFASAGSHDNRLVVPVVFVTVVNANIASSCPVHIRTKGALKKLLAGSPT